MWRFRLGVAAVAVGWLMVAACSPGSNPTLDAASTSGDVCESAVAMDAATSAVAALGYPDVTDWQAGLGGPNRDRMPHAGDLAALTGLACEWECSVASADGEWVAAAVAWHDAAMLGVVRLTHPPQVTLVDSASYWFASTGPIEGSWLSDTIFIGTVAGDEPVAIIRSGGVEPPPVPEAAATTDRPPVSCPHVAPHYLPNGVNGGPSDQPGIVWTATSGAVIDIGYTTSPDHPASAVTNATRVEFDGGTATFATVNPDDPHHNAVARIDIAGADPACGTLVAQFGAIDATDVTRILSSLTITGP